MGDPFTAQRRTVMDFSFADNKEVVSLDKVPTDFQGLYKETEEGSFTLDSENPTTKSAVSAIIKLNEALKISRVEAKGLKGKAVDLSTLSDYGNSVEEIASSFKTKVEELESQLAGNSEAKLNLDKIKEDLNKGHAKEIQAKDGKLEALSRQLDRVMVESVAKSTVAEAKGDIELLMPFVTNQIKNVEEDGEYKVYVVDAAGDKRFSGTTGEPMSIKELVQEMKGSDKFAKLFLSEQKSGGGMEPGAAKKNLSKAPTDTLSAVQKINEGLKKAQNLTRIHQ
jgi:hypothetical protein